MSIAALRRSVPRLSRSAVDRCSSSSNPAALAAFRRLMRARAALFMGDDFALGEARIKLREEFGAARDVTDPAYRRSSRDQGTRGRRSLANGQTSSPGTFPGRLLASA